SAAARSRSAAPKPSSCRCGSSWRSNKPAGLARRSGTGSRVTDHSCKNSVVPPSHSAIVILTLAACGSGAPPEATPTEPPPAHAADVTPDAGVPDAQDPPKLACDGDTVVTPAPFPEPTWFCGKPDGTREGPFETLYPDNTIEVLGSYKDGKLDGAW